MDYQYPISYDWSTNETIEVIAFYTSVEKAYEKGVEREELMTAYKQFKSIVPSIAEEKKLCNELEELSGYSAYQVIQKAKKGAPGDKIKMQSR
ncbi:UPF0223 family protein [Bacillus sp. AFS017336]|uniref:UPF0223 family protein n=1 Tax=Bacillus sp. AFS017336 TaxID=2033489 RepID=UPI000BF05CC4|nr:UPF0223 family protein [Bacillus sp. AFS017336]PEL10614.1 hypothetical protein CN601_12775 [Bacillus sp. AFS017336]